MTGPRNTLRRLVSDGRPVATGLHGIGDSVCTTNPTFGRGLSLAVWGAADLVDVIGKHDDPAEQTIAMDERAAEHIVPYYEEQAAVDSARLATLRHAVLGGPAPPPPPLRSDRISFTQLRVAASVDPTAFRAFWKLMFMLCQPDDVYRDPHIVARTQDALRSRGMDVLQPRGHLDPGIAQPTRQQVLAALAAGLPWGCTRFAGRAPMVTEPGGHNSAADRQRLRLRASHADREQVIDVLKVAFVQGRLTKDELDSRTGQVFSAKTYADLAAVTADLPPRPAATPRPPQQVNIAAAAHLTIVAIAIPVVLASIGYLTGSDGLVKVAVLVIVFDLLALLAAAAQVLESQYRRRAAQRRTGRAHPPAHSP